MNSINKSSEERGNRIGLIIGGGFGLLGFGLVALSTPFLLPALRKHCLPYVPATDSQLESLSIAIKKHARKGERMLDVGSGDGRICRMSSSLGIFSEVHGVELNYLLVLFSRIMNFRYRESVRYFRKDLWKFPINTYDSVCIFGVESMMDPFQQYLLESNKQPQTVYACRFQFKQLKQIDEVGSGIDTVWIYRTE